jgi:predicted dehydrogenase
VETIHIGVIGCGGMGRAVLRQLLACDERLEVVGLYDPDPAAVQKARAGLKGAPAACPDLASLLAIPSLQWVMIASWNCFHHDQVIAAFQAGKHVFCQKPLALTAAECARIRKAWKRSGRSFHIGFTLRYSPHYRRIRELLAEGRIGRLISMEFNETLDFNHGGYIMGDWRRLRACAGTHLLEKCCHDVDLANWMVGARAARVASFGGLNFFTPDNAHHAERIGSNEEGAGAYRTWGGPINLDPFTSDKNIVDNQVAIIEYENEVRATFHTNCNAGIPERRMYLLGTEGALRADVLAGRIELRRIGFDTRIEDLSTSAQGGHGEGDAVLARELAESMLHGTPPSVGMDEGIRSAVTCFAIDEAMDTGRVVDVAPLWPEAGL